MRFNVINKERDYLLVEVMNSGIVKNRKGVNTPGVHVVCHLFLKRFCRLSIFCKNGC